MNFKRFVNTLKSIVVEPKVFALVVRFTNGQEKLSLSVAYSLEEAIALAKKESPMEFTIKMWHFANVAEVVDKAYDFTTKKEEVDKIDKNLLIKDIIEKRDLTKFKKHKDILTKEEVALIEDRLRL